ETIPENLRLPSLQQNRLEGYAYLFRIVLPLLNAQGKDIFTDPILDELFQVLDDRFGGCMVASSSSAPPLWGLWRLCNVIKFFRAGTDHAGGESARIRVQMTMRCKATRPRGFV